MRRSKGIRFALDLAGGIEARPLLGISFIAGVVWAALLMLRSPGTPTHDEIGHFLVARDAWRAPQLMLNEWGRAANTLLYMPSALLGLPAARVWSLGLSIITALLTVRLSKQLGVSFSWAVPLLYWFQPWVANLSFAAITEVPFSMSSVAAASAAVAGQFSLAGLLIGLLPLIRHEGILLVGCWVAVCMVQRRWFAVTLSLAPLAAYNLVSAVTSGQLPLAMYFAPKPNDAYAGGDWPHYIPRLVSGVGVPITILAILALPALIKTRHRALVFASYGVYLATHVILYRFDLFATGGYRLLLFPLAPAFAIAGAFGLQALSSMLNWAYTRQVVGHTKLRCRLLLRRTRVHPQAALATVAALVIAVGLSAPPYPREPTQVAMSEAVSWLHAKGIDRARVVATHVWFYYLFPQAIDPGHRDLWAVVSPLPSLAHGSIVVWDRDYSDRWGIHRGALLRSDDWELLQDFEDGAVTVFRKR